MPILNFQSQFAPMVESGEKTQTIRAHRKYPIRVGQMLYLYTGLRRPGARLLKTTTCTEEFGVAFNDMPMRPLILSYGRFIGWNSPEADELARRDGFGSALEMLDWFRATHGFPFVGQVIRW